MKLKFLRDFRGRATNEKFYRAGTVAELDAAAAAALLAEGVAGPAPLGAKVSGPDTDADDPQGLRHKQADFLREQLRRAELRRWNGPR